MLEKKSLSFKKNLFYSYSKLNKKKFEGKDYDMIKWGAKSTKEK